MQDKGYNIPYAVIGSGPKHKEASYLTKAALMELPKAFTHKR
jgi:hypothetical protein